MREFTIIITDNGGLHARPAGKIASLSKTFKSEIKISVGDKEADGKRLLSLMSLGAKIGTPLHFSISGEDENEAYEGLLNLAKELEK